MPYRFKYTLGLNKISTLQIAFPPDLPPKNKRNDYKDIKGTYQFAVERCCGCDTDCTDVEVANHEATSGSGVSEV